MTELEALRQFATDVRAANSADGTINAKAVEAALQSLDAAKPDDASVAASDAIAEPQLTCPVCHNPMVPLIQILDFSVCGVCCASLQTDAEGRLQPASSASIAALTPQELAQLRGARGRSLVSRHLR